MKVTLSKNEKDLLQACMNGDVDTVEKLLNEGGNVDLICNDYGETLLMVAVSNNHELVVDALIEHGANVNAKDNNGETALMCAYCEDLEYNDAIVKMLLDNGADVNISDVSGYTALMRVCVTGNVEAVKNLLAHKARVNMKSVDGETALSLTCEYREYIEKIEIARELIDRGASLNNI